MLDDTPKDAEIVRDWLRKAIGSDIGTKARLAARCNVTPQAVSGWLRTGRISKTNLAMAEDFFGNAPRFTNHVTLRQPPARYANHGASSWPFSRLNLEAINRLQPDEKLQLEAAWIAAAAALGLRVTKRNAA